MLAQRSGAYDRGFFVQSVKKSIASAGCNVTLPAREMLVEGYFYRYNILRK